MSLEETIAILPHNKDAEEFILGAVLLENSAIGKLLMSCLIRIFILKRNRMLYEEIADSQG
jgi:replicative DNA helicase